MTDVLFLLNHSKYQKPCHTFEKFIYSYILLSWLIYLNLKVIKAFKNAFKKYIYIASAKFSATRKSFRLRFSW